MKKSFTLIEIIIVIIIIIILSSIGLAYYNNYSQQITLKSEGENLVNELELLKKKSLSSEKPTNCSEFQGYQINLNENSYQWGILCPDFQLIKSKTLPYGINYLNNQTITFSPLKIYFSSPIIIQIKNNQLNKCLIINISINGIINLDETLQNCQ